MLAHNFVQVWHFCYRIMIDITLFIPLNAEHSVSCTSSSIKIQSLQTIIAISLFAIFNYIVLFGLVISLDHNIHLDLSDT